MQRWVRHCDWENVESSSYTWTSLSKIQSRFGFLWASIVQMSHFPWFLRINPIVPPLQLSTLPFHCQPTTLPQTETLTLLHSPKINCPATPECGPPQVKFGLTERS